MHVEAPHTLGYTVGEEVARQGRFSVLRAQRSVDGVRVLLKLAARGDNSEGDTQALACEQALIGTLPPTASLPVLALERIDGRPALVLDGPDGDFLSRLLGPQPMPPPAFLDLALSIAKALAEIHGVGIVHRGLQPACIFVEPLRARARLAGLGVATRLPRAFQRLSPAGLGDGSLAYLAPEQTGRTNHAVDRRADLYALGIVFYRLLTGRLPFVSDDPLELVHAHLARSPTPPAEMIAGLAPMLSDIVLRLLAKAPDERYRSAVGLIADLGHCRESLARHGRIDAVPLARADPADQLEIPERLYGRNAEVQTLLRAFAQVREGSSALLTVGGHAGVGKTALVLAVQAPILAARGHFATGKFDQLTRDQPYSALIHALNDLASQLLADSESLAAKWRERLADRLGDSAPVLTAVVPGLDMLLGQQQPPPALDPEQGRNRLELAFRRLIAALATRDHPLVLFLDDLQWADSASLALLSALLGDDAAESCLVIGAFRDNEVATGHPLEPMLEALHGSGALIEQIELASLDTDALTAMLADTFAGSAIEVATLARLVHEKTLGNPFFARTFIQIAFDRGLIRYRPPGGWIWDVAEIAREQPTNNVIALLTERIDVLEAGCRNALEIAACIGNRFAVGTLATLCTLAVDPLRRRLSPALAMGLVQADDASGSESYAFCHDRVQEAAHDRIAVGERERLHRRIGELLLSESGEEPPAERLFEIVDHLNQAGALQRERGQRRRLAALNLDAGRRARAAAAFQAALRYFNAGVHALGARPWAKDYALAYPLVLGRAECAHLCQQSERAEADIERLLRHARTAAVRAAAYRLRMVNDENHGQFAAAVRAGNSALALFGIRFPSAKAAKRAEIETSLGRIDEAVRRHVGGGKVAVLAELPPLQDPELRAALDVLMTLWAPAYISGDKDLTVLIAARIVELSLIHGNTPASAYGYVTYAITLGALRGDHAAAYAFGELALAVNRRFDDLGSRAKINHMFSCYIGFWRRPIAESFAYSGAAFRSGVESGDLVYAAYGCFHESWHALFSGMRLADFERDYAAKLGFLARVRNTSFHDAHRLMLQWSRGLRGLTATAGALSGPDFDELEYLGRHAGMDFFVAFHHIARLALHYTLGDIPAACDMAHRAESVALGVRGMIWDAWLCLYSALALAAKAEQDQLSKHDHRHLARRLDHMARWARSCPANFGHLHRLLAAECARIDADPAGAIDHFEAAIAEAGDFIQHRAIAKERYAAFWLERGNRQVASVYLVDAMADFAAWGADAKVRQLRARWPDLLAGPLWHRLAAGGELPPSDPLDSAALVTATRILSGETAPERVAELLLRLLMQSVGAERAVLLESRDGSWSPVLEGYPDGDGIGVARIAAEPDGGAGAGPRFARVSEAAVEVVVNSHRTLVAGNVSADKLLAADPGLRGRGVRAVMCLPILHGSVLTGVVYLEHRTLAEVFTPAVVDLAEALAAQAGISLENARLIQRVRSEASQRETAERRLRLVAQGTAAAVGAGFFRELVRHLAQALGVRIAFVTECTGPDRVRSLAFIDAGRFVEGVEYELEGTPCKSVIDGAVVCYPDQLAARFPKERGLAAYLGVPLFGAEGNVVGHLAVVHDEPMALDHDDEELLKVFAVRAATELERQRAAVQAERYQRDVAEKRRLAAIGGFASMIAHEIRTPLTTIGLALDHLRTRQASVLPGRSLARLELASAEKQRLDELLTEVLQFARNRELVVAHLDLDALVRETIAAIRDLSAADRRRIDYRSPPGPCRTDGDLDKLKQVLINLLTNACQAIEPDEVVRVRLSGDPAAGSVRLDIQNPGQIPEDLVDRLTEPFFSTKPRGTGLGLAIVQQIVTAHSGNLEIRSTKNEGVLVRILLPAASIQSGADRPADAV